MQPEQTTIPPLPPKKESLVKEIVKFTITAVVLIFIIRTYIAQPFIVNGGSMDPTFSSGQYLIVDELTYDFRAPQREDVVIFRYPRDPQIYYIKRIIGLPGETITMKNGDITITNAENPKGFALPDPHVTPDRKTFDNFTTTLGPTEYFVMGDNRAQSSDSRAWGPLESKYIIGRPFMSLAPFSKIGLFPGK